MKHTVLLYITTFYCSLDNIIELKFFIEIMASGDDQRSSTVPSTGTTDRLLRLKNDLGHNILYCYTLLYNFIKYIVKNSTNIIKYKI